MKFAERKGGVLEEPGIRPGIVEEQEDLDQVEGR